MASCAAATHAPLRLGSWNIQNFGNAKTGRPAVMAAIGGIAARYDVLSVQELSQVPTNPGSCSVDGETGTAACSLLGALNGAAAPRTFALAASPRACTFDSCGDATTYNEFKNVCSRWEEQPVGCPHARYLSFGAFRAFVARKCSSTCQTGRLQAAELQQAEVFALVSQCFAVFFGKCGIT